MLEFASETWDDVRLAEIWIEGYMEIPLTSTEHRAFIGVLAQYNLRHPSMTLAQLDKIEAPSRGEGIWIYSFGRTGVV